ncbi:MAG: copper-containing nitrite reductase [Acetobacteraceae bacterium]
MTLPLPRRSMIRALPMGAIGFAAAGGLIRSTSAVAATAASHPDAAPLATTRVAADPARLPPPIRRDYPVHHHITLVAREVVAEVKPGTTFRFMTFGGQVPGPMIRVRQGDTVTVTLHNDAHSKMNHNVDMHAIYATGGGAVATLVEPGQTRSETFLASYPGAFIYHCAVPGFLDQHISSGMFGMIVVEPTEGLREVDREFYIGQHELYTQGAFGAPGHQQFSFDKMIAEDPTYVLFNGAVQGLTPARYGAMQAKVGERIRVFMVCGGPNLTSSFHPIGNVWSRCWPQGALADAPRRFVQTEPVCPGSCFVGEMDLPVPEVINLVDHALTRVVHKGLLAQIAVTGPADRAVFRAG